MRRCRPTSRRAVLAAAAALVFSTLALAPVGRAGGDELGPLLDALRTAEGEEARAEARRAVLKTRPKADELLKAIAEEMTFSKDVRRGVFSADVPGAELPVEVFVPEDYDPSKPVPVLVGLHGTNGSGKQILEPAVGACRERGWILVCPSLPDPDIGSAMRKAATTGFGWGDHEDNLALVSLRWLLRHYRVDTDRVYLMGVSQGGYGAWGIGTCYAWRWAAVLPYAGGIDHRENNGGLDLIQRIPKTGIPDGYLPKGLAEAAKLAGGGRRRDLLKNTMNTPVFFVHGAKDDVVKPDGDRESDRELTKLGYGNHRYVEKEDWGHRPKELDDAMELVEEMLAWAEEKVRKTNPKQIVHFSPREDTGRAWWITLDELEPGALVEASVEDDLVTIETEGVKRFTLHLSDDLLSLRKRVKIALNGKPVGAKRFRGDPEAVLDSYIRDWDPKRVYEVAVTIDVP